MVDRFVRPYVTREVRDLTRPTARCATLAATATPPRHQAGLELALALLAALGAFVAAGLLPSLAWSANPTSSSISKVLCEVIFMFTGPIGILLAAIAICILGLTAALGRISWPVALTTVVGIAIIFGAGSILDLFQSGGSSACTGVKNLDAPALETVLCRVFTVLQGSVGAALATIAVCMLGIGALLGKVQWATAVTTILGLVVLFSASSVLQVLFAKNGGLGGLPLSRYLEHCGSPTLDFGYFSQAMCGIAAYMSGKKGFVVMLLGTMGVWILSFSAMFGRISWGTALTVGVGIAILFGSSSIVGLVTRRNIACPIYGAVATYNASIAPPTSSAGGQTDCVDPISGLPVNCAALAAQPTNGYTTYVSPCGSTPPNPDSVCIPLANGGFTWAKP